MIYTKNVSVVGKYDRLTKQQTRKLCGLLGRSFVGERIWSNCGVVVQYAELDVFGYCSPTDWSSRYPREFEILLNRKSTKKTQIATIIHEMVHLKQYALGELKNYDRGGYRWLGKKLMYEEKDYGIMPWEIEASQYEKFLLPHLSKMI